MHISLCISSLFVNFSLQLKSHTYIQYNVMYTSSILFEQPFPEIVRWLLAFYKASLGIVQLAMVLVNIPSLLIMHLSSLSVAFYVAVKATEM